MKTDDSILEKKGGVKKPTRENPAKKPTKQYTDFISSHYVTKENPKSITNTRIGDKNANIPGGSFHIPDAEYAQFLELYGSEIVAKNLPEYFTEKQLEGPGPILADLDLRYDYSVTEKQYELCHIEDIVDHYLDVLKSFYQFDENTRFLIFVQEKDTVNRVAEKQITKDGIHLVIGIQADRQTQIDLRKKIIPLVAESCASIPITNTWEDVFDNAITVGTTGWQLYGSRKPSHDVYKVTRIYEITYDEDDGECSRSPIQLNEFDIVKNLYQLSARCTTHPSFIYTSEYLKTRSTVTAGKPTPQIRSQNRFMDIDVMNSSVLKISNHDELKSAVDSFIDSLLLPDYDLREAHDYTMILPESYYEEGSFTKWIRVGWALRNISDRLLIVWIAFSAKSESWSFSTGIPDLYERWQSFDLKNHNGLTKHSIMHWAKQDAPDQYKHVRATCIDYYIDQTVRAINIDNISSDRNSRGCTDFDIANVLYQLFKTEYVCVSVKNNIWYRLRGHLWLENDSGTSLRKAISTILRDLYWKRANDFIEQAGSLNPPDEERTKRLQDLADKILKICERLGRANEKKNIMTEAKELFYDANFVEKLDTNPFLLSFKNGVLDMKAKCFRRGYPEDYLSKCTNNDYIPIDEARDGETMAEIRDFMRKLFPIEEIHDYMWEHLASILIGTSSANQTFNMYIGAGQNGKSVLTDLMTLCLGQYKGDVPLSLVTDRRTKIGGLAPELLALKGVRLALMQEPSEGDQLNEGVMKQLTSGLDPIQARAPYMLQSVTFLPQFKLVVCSNAFMVIKSLDHGTWRRIRVVDFVSLFCDNPVQGDADKPHQFLIDRNLKDEKFEKWKYIFTAMLVEIVFRTNGIVKDCNRVMASSNSYKNSLDYVGDFIKDKVIVEHGAKMYKNEVTTEFDTWYQATYGNDKRGRPSAKNVHAYMDKQFGKYEKHKAWIGCRINYITNTNATNSDEDEPDDIRNNDL